MPKYIKPTHLLRNSTVRRAKRNANVLKDFQAGMESWQLVAKYRISRQRITDIVKRELELQEEANNV